MRLTLAAGALALALAGCGNQQATTTAQNTVAALEVSLTAAEQAATAYAKLPRCGQSATIQLCSNQEVVDSLKALDNKAYTAVKQAEAVTSDATLMAAAETAVSLFARSVP